jgi:hypothetical protein
VSSRERIDLDILATPTFKARRSAVREIPIRSAATLSPISSHTSLILEFNQTLVLSTPSSSSGSSSSPRKYCSSQLFASLPMWTICVAMTCRRSIVGRPDNWHALAMLAAANAWPGHDKEAKEAAAQLQKVYPGFTVQTWASIDWTDYPRAHCRRSPQGRSPRTMTAARRGQGGICPNCDLHRRETSPSRTIRLTLSHTSTIAANATQRALSGHLTRTSTPSGE